MGTMGKKTRHGAGKPPVAPPQVRGLPPFQKMWDAYPDASDVHDVGTLIGGHVLINLELPEDKGQWKNTCAVRTSRALNYAGDPIPGPSRFKLKKGGTMDVVSGSDKLWYAHRVTDLEEYLRRTYGSPSDSVEPGKGGVDMTRFGGRKGIVVYEVGWDNATGHIDLWDGTKVRHEDFSKEPKLTKVLFWEAYR
jgi:hypothetical protein